MMMLRYLLLLSVLLLAVDSIKVLPLPPNQNFRQDMRTLVGEISSFAKKKHPRFQIVVQSASDLLLPREPNNGAKVSQYISALDGISQPALFYGFFERPNDPTPPQAVSTWKTMLSEGKKAGKPIFVMDIANKQNLVDKSVKDVSGLGYIPFVAESHTVSNVPKFPTKIPGLNTNNIISVKQAKNFLYLVNPHYRTKSEFLSAVRATNYDVVVIDTRFGGQTITSTDVSGLKQKKSGGKRLVFAYVPIAEADTTRNYWKSGWKTGRPAFIDDDYPKMSSNHKVRYWDPQWKTILFSGKNSQMINVLNSGFDGAFLEASETYRFFENSEDTDFARRRRAAELI